MWEPLAWVTLMNNIRSLLSPVEGVETVLRGLAQAVDETVILAYPDAMARHMGITAYALPDKAMKIDPRAWRIAPMHCSAAGKAYLTGKSGVELEAWARPGLPPVTPRSMTSVQALSGDIARARDQGYAVAIEERVLGTAEVGVPVRDDRDNVVGGLQVCARAELVTEQHIKQWARLLADASVKLTAILYIVGAGDPNITTHLGGVGQGGSNPDSGGTERNRRPYRVV
jgi:DNA-binding IclR family transcriptional regulator